MRVIELTEGTGTAYTTALLLHGGGEVAYGVKHPLISAVQGLAQRVAAVELPLHGKSCVAGGMPLADALAAFKRELGAVMAQGRVLFVAYSLGGLMLIRTWMELEHTVKHTAVFVGVSLQGSAEQEPLVSRFWTPESFRARGAEKVMRKLHGEHWTSMVRQLNPWFRVRSDLWLSHEALEEVVAATSGQWFFVIGKREQPFPPVNTLTVLDKMRVAECVHVVDADHFTYFSAKWHVTRNAMEGLVLGVERDESEGRVKGVSQARRERERRRAEMLTSRL